MNSASAAMPPQGPARPHSPATHRPDIDGLRAVAILSVLCFHADRHWLPGGFVGVDVFFVISGYLISGIILGDLQRGNFSFTQFYVRRIKRIFPALLVVLLFACVVGWLTLFPDEFKQLGKHVLAGCAFVSNIMLWGEAGYFDVRQQYKPLLHLWSLGIEEQFYIFWPPLLLLLWRWPRVILPTIVAITLTSFALNVARISGHETAVFYLPPTRVWELSLGGILAHARRVGLGTPASPAAGRIRAALAVVGLALLLVALFGLNEDIAYPGWGALLPTVGTFLLIAVGPDTWINRYVLGNRLMVFVGLISYPLYLWHWPLLSFPRILTTEPTTAFKLGILALAFVLAWLTYKLVENPIRTSRFKLQPSLALLFGLAAVGVIGYLSFSQRIEPRTAKGGFDRVLDASATLPFPGPHLTHSRSDGDSVWRQGHGAKTVLFLGDSNIQQYYPRIDWLLTQNPDTTKSIVFVSSVGCVPIPNVRDRHHPYCDGLVDRAMNLAVDPHIDTVVIGARWPRYFMDPDTRFSYVYDDAGSVGPITLGAAASDKAFLALGHMIQRLRALGKHVVIVMPMPTGDEFDPHELVERGLFHLDYPIRVPTVPAAPIVAQMQPVVAKLSQIARETGAQVIDPVTALCDASTCRVVTPDGLPLYRDDGHLNPAYVRQDIHFFDAFLSLE